MTKREQHRLNAQRNMLLEKIRDGEIVWSTGVRCYFDTRLSVPVIQPYAAIVEQLVKEGVVAIREGGKLMVQP